jgi:DNA-directed RNA polymerase specialized sigma24 family protein
LKACLRNLVRDQHAARRNWPGPLPEALADDGYGGGSPDDPAAMTFEEGLRQELLQRAWSALEQANSAYHAVLMAHVHAPGATAAELAVMWAARTGCECNASRVRVMLHRARRKLAGLLVGEVQGTLPEANGTELRDELEALGLSEICRHALEASSSCSTVPEP